MCDFIKEMEARDEQWNKPVNHLLGRLPFAVRCFGPGLLQSAQSEACSPEWSGFPGEICHRPKVKPDAAAFSQGCQPTAFSLWRPVQSICLSLSQELKILIISLIAVCNMSFVQATYCFWWSSSFSARALEKGQKHLTMALQRINIGRTLVCLLMNSKVAL